jgi:hypothetical protein
VGGSGVRERSGSQWGGVEEAEYDEFDGRSRTRVLVVEMRESGDEFGL